MSPTILRTTWTQLYHTTLPALAKARDPAQPHWPVFLDHCFARIILDNAIGVTQPWASVIKAPAVRNMSETQLMAAIELGERIVSGEADLVGLDAISLRLRGKLGKGKVGGSSVKREVEDGVGVGEAGEDWSGEGLDSRRKRKADMSDDGAVAHVTSLQKKRKVVKKKDAAIGTISKYFPLSTNAESRKVIDASNVSTDITSTRLQQADVRHTNQPRTSPHSTMTPAQEEQEAVPRSFISGPPRPQQNKSSNPPDPFYPALAQPRELPFPVSSTSEAEKGLHLLTTATQLTPFRREVLSLLCTIPRGQWTTYAAMARHVNRVRSQLHTQTDRPLALLPTSSPPSTVTAIAPPVTKAKAKAKAKAPPSQTQTCARAIGNAMRNNPFAPLIPCHRVLAADGGIGGFGGHWGEDGRFAGEKKKLLRDEGVRFDGKGRAVGGPWEGWKAEEGMHCFLNARVYQPDYSVPAHLPENHKGNDEMARVPPHL